MNAHIAIITPIEAMKYRPDEAPYSIIDARPYRDYIAGHIPGAVWIGWETWCEAAPDHAGQTLAQAGYWGVLRDQAAELVQESLRQIGLSNDRPALVYADGPISKGREARIAWMLLYWGISSALLLDGGWSAWLRYGGSSDVATPAPRYGQFNIQVQEYRRVHIWQLKQALQDKSLPLLIDTRSRAEYAGHRYAYLPRMGRLPGAVPIPYTDFFDEEGKFISQSIYLQCLPPEVRNASQCIAYCEVGVRSCLFALLHELYTGKIVANFDGSFMEWALDRTLPIECGTD